MLPSGATDELEDYVSRHDGSDVQMMKDQHYRKAYYLKETAKLLVHNKNRLNKIQVSKMSIIVIRVLLIII